MKWGRAEQLPLLAPSPRANALIGILLISLGVVLAIAALGYTFYAVWARSQLDELVYNIPASESEVVVEGGPSGDAQAGGIGPQSQEIGEEEPPGDGNLFAPLTASFSPAQALPPWLWLEPLWGEPPSTDQVEFFQQYREVDWGSLPTIVGSMPKPARIRIPAFDLDSQVQELAVVTLAGEGGSYFETPSNTVGHIPGSASPGEAGNGYLFGHINSPLMGEGSVFRDLPKIPGYLRRGEDVLVILDSDSGSYLYKVVRSEVIYQDDLLLVATRQPRITLVTCVPNFVYDHRLVVTAELVGFISA